MTHVTRARTATTRQAAAGSVSRDHPGSLDCRACLGWMESKDGPASLGNQAHEGRMEKQGLRDPWDILVPEDPRAGTP